MLLIDPDDERRESLATALRAAGFEVRTAARIADVDRWPSAEAVVTDAALFTRLWLDVGASWVVVMAQSPEEGARACARGATTWVPYRCDAATLRHVLNALDDAAAEHEPAFRAAARGLFAQRRSLE